MKKLLIFMVGCLILSCLQLPAQNRDFSSILQLAESQYKKELFEKAKSTLVAAKKNTAGITADQISEADRLIAKCEIAIAAKNRLVLSLDTLKTDFWGGVDSIGVTAGQKKKLTVTSLSKDWCDVVDITGDYIIVRVSPNAERKQRRTSLSVKMGTVGLTVPVVQGGRPETNKHVIINSTPDRARISIDGGTQNIAPWDHSLLAGSHRLRIEKQGYMSIDTTLVLTDDLKEEILRFNFKLKPQFGTLSMDIRPEEGFHFGSDPVLTLNGVKVDNSPRELYTFDDDRNIQTYTVYQGNVIPVYPGRVTINVSADNFESQKIDMLIREGENISVPVVLKAETGILNLMDAGNARDAVAFLDGREIGKVEEISNLRTQVGRHELTFRKSGFLPREKSYVLNIGKNRDTTVHVSLDRYAVFMFSSTPSDSRVYVDDEYIGNTPTKPYTVIKREDGKGFKVSMSRNNYMKVDREIMPDFYADDTLSVHFNLYQTHPLAVVADEEKVRLTVKDRRGGDTVFVQNVALPAEISIPVRKKPYWIEVDRFGQTAYKGRMRFSNENKTRHKITTWSKNNIQVISGNYFLSGNAPFTVGVPDPESGMMREYTNVGNINLLKVKLFKGFSTSMLRGSLFMGTDESVPLAVPKAIKGNQILPNVEYAMYLPAVSCLLINDEFRVGGALLDFLDIDAVASYAWYPDAFKSIVGFSYVSGHDIFIGGELSTRFPYLNVNIKAGMQMYRNLKANIYSAEINPTSNETRNQYYTENLPIPDMFVISVGFSIGGKDSKGNNMLRVF